MGTVAAGWLGVEPAGQAIAQVSPVYLDRKRSIERACETIREAAAGGAELIVFPEIVDGSGRFIAYDAPQILMADQFLGQLVWGDFTGRGETDIAAAWTDEPAANVTLSPASRTMLPPVDWRATPPLTVKSSPVPASSAA